VAGRGKGDGGVAAGSPDSGSGGPGGPWASSGGGGEQAGPREKIGRDLAQ
jgi:hypothetical protein